MPRPTARTEERVAARMDAIAIERDRQRELSAAERELSAAQHAMALAEARVCKACARIHDLDAACEQRARTMRAANAADCAVA